MFLEHFILNRFSVLDSLIFDNASYVSSIKLTKLAIEKGIKIKYSSNYYPQGNRIVESSNNVLIRILKKTVIENQINCHNALSNFLWENRGTPKVALVNYPYGFFHGKEYVLFPNLYLNHQGVLLLYYNKESIILLDWRKKGRKLN